MTKIKVAEGLERNLKPERWNISILGARISSSPHPMFNTCHLAEGCWCSSESGSHMMPCVGWWGTHEIGLLWPTATCPWQNKARSKFRNISNTCAFVYLYLERCLIDCVNVVICIHMCVCWLFICVLVWPDTRFWKLNKCRSCGWQRQQIAFILPLNVF